MNYIPFRGDLFLSKAIEIDGIHPNFLAGLMRTRGIHRHAMWAVLSLQEAVSPHYVRECLRETPKDIFRTVIGEVADGFIGALSRIIPIDPPDRTDFYSTLNEWFTSDDPKSKVIRQIEGRLTYSKLALLEKVHPAAMHPEVVRGLYRPNDCHILSGAVELVKIRCSGLSDEVISLSLRESARTHEWVQRILLRHLDSLPHQCLPVVEHYQPLQTGLAHREASKRMSNCLHQMVFLSALGRNVFYVSEDYSIAVDCRCLIGGGMVVSGIFGANNCPIPEERWHAVANDFAKAGIPAYAPLKRDQRAIGRLNMSMVDPDFPNIAEED